MQLFEDTKIKFLQVLCALVFFVFSAPVFAYQPGEGLEKKAAHEVPGELSGVGVFERLGETPDLTNQFIDESGAVVPLSKYFNQGKPVILSIVYYECPSLCNYHLNGVNSVLKNINLKPGKDFNLIAVTMNPEEGPILASDKRTPMSLNMATLLPLPDIIF
ncbi:MAG: SCO family protein [Bdellovibrionales bacterium]